MIETASFRTHMAFYLAGASISLLSGLLTPKGWIYPLFEHTGYYFILISFIVWIYLFITIIRSKFTVFIRKHHRALLLTLLLTTLIFIISPPRFKILSDETNLLGTSMSMFREKKTSLPIQGVHYSYKEPDYPNRTIDKRPLFHPFLVSIIHSLSGYRPQNVFAVNAISGWLTLFLIYLLVARYLGCYWGMIATLMASSMPLFSFWVTSGGFETINMLFVTLSLYLFTRMSPATSADEVAFFLFTLILCAQCRYESIIFSALIPMCYWICGLKKREEKIPLPILFSPLFYIPIFLQIRLYIGEPLVEEIHQRITYHKAFYSAFNPKNIVFNFPDNFTVFLGIDPHFGFSPVVSLLSLCGFYLFARKRACSIFSRFSDPLPPFILFALPLLILMAVQFSYFYSALTIFTQNRFALVYLPFIAIFSVRGAAAIFKSTEPNHRLAITLFFFFHLCINLPYAHENRMGNFGLLSNEYAKVTAIADKHFGKKDSILVVSDHPYIYLSTFGGAFDFAHVEKEGTHFQKKYQRIFDHILVLQRFSNGNLQPFRGNRLSSHFKFRRIATANLSEETYMIISRMENHE